MYRKWAKHKENAFYTTYCELLKHSAKAVEGGSYEVLGGFTLLRSVLFPRTLPFIAIDGSIWQYAFMRVNQEHWKSEKVADPMFALVRTVDKDCHCHA